MFRNFRQMVINADKNTLRVYSSLIFQHGDTIDLSTWRYRADNQKFIEAYFYSIYKNKLLLKYLCGYISMVYHAIKIINLLSLNLR